MKIYDRITSIFSRTQSESMVIAPPDPKTFSESFSEIKNFANEVSPDFPLDALPLLGKLALINPDFNQNLKRTINLSNTGLDWEFKGVSPKIAELMNMEIEDWFDKHPGVLNRLIRQTALTGALSAEPVPSMDFSEVETIQFIPVSQVRFRKVEVKGKNEEVRYKFAPVQILKNGDSIPLNENLYTYEPLETNEDSPYAIPPAISAIRAMFTQSKGMENIERSTKRWGFLGFISVLLPKFRLQHGQDLHSKEAESKRFLERASKDIQKSIDSGMLVGYDGTQIQYNNLNVDKGSGQREAWNLIEEQISSGMDIDLFVLGRPTAVTETYAKISSKMFLMSRENTRHPAKRFCEKAMTLHLRMKGFKFTRIKAKWKPGKSLNPEEDANVKKTNEEAENLRVDRFLKLRDAGIISDDDVAKIFGYEKATGNRISKNALRAILRHLGIDPLSQEVQDLVNTYEHHSNRNERDVDGSSEPVFSQGDENDEELDKEFQKKKGILTNVVPIRGRKH
ncbi:hypothetical protein ACO1KB_19200 [Leptospira interrogans serovar Szwajizak]|uniref:hypothetical protein n=1 Tax=Leptospira interrogans TaxID=173 RepID=UPI00046C893C|nr:hypothetical protein [Leptospira interrogans]